MNLYTKQKWGFPTAQWVKNPPAMKETLETQVWFLGGEDPLEDKNATHPSILAWKMPQSEKPSRTHTVHRVAESWAWLRHYQMVNTKIRMIVFFAAKDGEAPYSQQKQDQEVTVAQIMNSLLPNSNLNWRKQRKPLGHSGMT